MREKKISFKWNLLIPIIIIFVASNLIILGINIRQLNDVLIKKTNENLDIYTGSILAQIEQVNISFDPEKQILDEKYITGSAHGLVISNGQVYAYPDTALIGKDVSGENWYKSISSGNGYKWIEIDGVRYYSGYKNKGGKTAAGIIPEIEFNRTRNQSLTRPIILMVIAVLIMLAFLYMTVGALVAPVKSLVDGISRIAAGNPDAKIEGNYSGEFDKIKDAVNSMAVNIKEIHEYARLMMDATPLSCALWNTDIKLFDCNKKTLEIFEMSVKEEFSQKFQELSPEYQPDGRHSIQAIHQVVGETIEKGLNVFEWMHQLPSGEPLPVEITLVRVNLGNENFVAAYMRDLREHKQIMSKLKDAAERAQAASHSKSAFLANMSHEIRTPMNSIVGFSELALDENVPPKIKDYLNKILENSEWLLQIINDILDISKIESGKMDLENIPFDLHELFASCRTVIMPKAIEKGLTMHFYAEPSVGKILYGDPTRLRQVLVNLLSNAVKFTNSGLIKVQATVKNVATDSVTMSFEIKDSGIGITPEQLELIFEPFMQAETGTTRKFGGSGLGLSITKNIIEMMGSALKVDSVPGVGSKFSFVITFDAVDTDNDETIVKHIVYNDIQKPTFEGLILLCEDNVMNQKVICEHLARVGLKTEVASNGKQGVEMVKARARKGEKQYDLIFMDIHMPVMDGLEASSEISKYDPGISIVAMTANIMSNDREIYISKGMNNCVSKPFTSQELWRCLLKYFKPVKWQKVDAAQNEQSDGELRQKIINNFMKDNRGKYEEIKKAINAEDITLAYRLVHTLKSNAGQLDKILLYNAAGDLEKSLNNEENHVTPDQLEVLEKELNAVITELTPLVREADYQIVTELNDAEAARETLDKLKSLLEDSDSDCLELIGSLQMIPGSGELIEQIENFEFKNAMKTLAELNKKVFND